MSGFFIPETPDELQTYDCLAFAKENDKAELLKNMEPIKAEEPSSAPSVCA